MRALFASTAGAGHVGPLLPLAGALVALGHEVELLVPPGAEWLGEGHGLEVTTGAAPPAAEMDELWGRFAASTRSEQRRIAEREAFAGRCADAMLPAVAAVVARRRPDLVVREPCEYASAVVAGRQDLPLATVGISFAAAEWSVLDFVADLLDRHGAGMRDALGAAPFLTRFPPGLDPSPFPRTMRYAERRTLRPGGGEAGPSDPFPPGPGPLLYVTFGSRVGAMDGARAAFGTVLAAVAGIEARVLVTVGRDLDPASLGPVPANVAVQAWVDQEQVLARCDAVLCHGGSGTTMGALAHGVPVGFLPFFADQPANARAVVAAGAGLLPDGPARVPAVRAMAEALLGDARYRAAARRLASEMAALPGVDELAASLAAWVEQPACPAPR